MSTTKKRRIAVIGLKGLPAFGGAATVGENLIEQLKGDYYFTVLSMSSHTHHKTGDYNGYKQVVFKSFLGKGGLNTAWYYFVSMLYVLVHKFDFVHLHHTSTGYIVPLLSLKCKTILTVHENKIEPDPKFNKVLNYLGFMSDRIALKGANTIVSVSNNDKKILSKKLNRDVMYIPNGINRKTDTPQKTSENSTLLFSAGRIYPLKGLHLLVEAAQKLNLKEEIKIIGDIDRVPAYKQEILQGIQTLNVNVLGLIKSKRDLLDIVYDSGLFIFPSLREAMSMMLLEAASMRTPIIASDIPANTAVFSDEEVLFFKSGDAQDLAQKITYAQSNMEEMHVKAEKAYEKLINNYTWDKIAKQYQVIYDEIK